MSNKYITFAIVNKKIRIMAIETLNISSIIIRLRLHYVGGSDEVCV